MIFLNIAALLNTTNIPNSNVASTPSQNPQSSPNQQLPPPQQQYTQSQQQLGRQSNTFIPPSTPIPQLSQPFSIPPNMQNNPLIRPTQPGGGFTQEQLQQLINAGIPNPINLLNANPQLMQAALIKLQQSQSRNNVSTPGISNSGLITSTPSNFQTPSSIQHQTMSQQIQNSQIVTSLPQTDQNVITGTKKSGNSSGQSQANPSTTKTHSFETDSSVSENNKSNGSQASLSSTGKVALKLEDHSLTLTDDQKKKISVKVIE